MTFRKFEDIEAWKLARELCRIVKDLTDKPSFDKDWTLKNQMRAASGSVMDCIAEGYERDQTKEFKYFLGVAKGSSGEVRSQAYRALDYGYITPEEQKKMHTLCIRISSAIFGLINHLKKTKHKGNRERPLDKRPDNDYLFPSTPPGSAL